MDASPPIKAPGAVLEPRPPSSDAMARSNSTVAVASLAVELASLLKFRSTAAVLVPRHSAEPAYRSLKFYTVYFLRLYGMLETMELKS